MAIANRLHHSPPLLHPAPKNHLETTAAIIHTEYGDITVISAYLPPQCRFIDHSFHNTLPSGQRTIIAGDLNAKHVTWGSNRSGRALRRWADANSISVIVPKVPTRYSHSGRGDVLDIFLISSFAIPKAIFTIPALASDHLPVIAFFGAAPTVKCIPLRRDIKRADWNGFRTHLREALPQPPTSIDTAEELDAAAEKLVSQIQEAVDAEIAPNWSTKDPTSSRNNCSHQREKSPPPQVDTHRGSNAASHLSPNPKGNISCHQGVEERHIEVEISEIKR